MTSRIDHNNPHGEGALSLTYHYEMLSDSRRIEPFLRAIDKVSSNKIILESGTGTGILSILAARAGAKRVFAVEIDPVMAEIAAENIRRSGYGNVITLLNKSTLDVTLNDLNGERVDVVVAENLSTWQVTEPENQVMNYISQNLAKPSAIRLPERAENYVELVEAQFTFYDTIELKAHYFQFTGISEPAVRSHRTLFSVFDYSKSVDTQFSSQVVLTAKTAGIVNALRLTSPLCVHQDIKFHSSDSLMPPVIVPLQSAVQVAAGDELRVFIRYTTNTNWAEFYCELEACISKNGERGDPVEVTTSV